MDNMTKRNTGYTLTSMEVAEMVGKEHNNLMRDIRRYLAQLGQVKIGQSDFFIASTYINSQNKQQPCFNVTKKGCEFIGNKLTGQKGTEFTARYVNRFNELEENSVSVGMLNALNAISDSMKSMRDEFNSRLEKLEDTPNRKKLPGQKYSHWKTTTFEKLNALFSHITEHSDNDISYSKMISLLINEMDDIYNIDLNDYVEMYKEEYSLSQDDRPYPLDVINHYKDIRDMFTLTLDSILEKLNIRIQKVYTRNIFDELAEKISKNQEKGD